MNGFVATRTLTEYPRGAHRWSLLLLTVLASILGAYDFQLAPLLPILLPYLHMSHVAYGAFITFAVLTSGISAFFGGPLADRYGRVLIIDVCLGFVTGLLFLNVLITGIVSFVILRTLMGIVAGVTAGAFAALIRDMSPRLSRALAFGLLTIGPVGANFLANFVAGATLPIYHTWQSQIWIMGFIAIAMYIPIVLWLCDLSPELRMQIMKTEILALAAEGRLPSASELPSGTSDAFRRLLGHLEVWLLVIGITANLTLYFAIQGFGPLMFTEAFHYTCRSGEDDRILLAGEPRRPGLDGAGVRPPANTQTDRNLRRGTRLALDGLVDSNLRPRASARHDGDGRVADGMLSGNRLRAVGRSVLRDSRGRLARSASDRMGILQFDSAGMGRNLCATVALRCGPLRMGRVGQGRAGWNDNLHRRDGVHSRPCGG